MAGFEDVDVSVMLKELLFAVPCLLVSLALWYFVLRRTDRTPVLKEKFTIAKIAAAVKSIHPIKDLKQWVSELIWWKWIVFFVSIAIFFLSSLLLKRPMIAAPFAGLGMFLGMIFIFRVFKTRDLENMLLIIASGLIGSRHGIYFREFNFVYPVLSFVIAGALFLPGEIRASAREKRAKIQKKEDVVIRHDRLVYYLPAGYLTTTILYFLTSF